MQTVNTLYLIYHTISCVWCSLAHFKHLHGCGPGFLPKNCHTSFCGLSYFFDRPGVVALFQTASLTRISILSDLARRNGEG